MPVLHFRFINASITYAIIYMPYSIKQSTIIRLQYHRNVYNAFNRFQYCLKLFCCHQHKFFVCNKMSYCKINNVDIDKLLIYLNIFYDSTKIFLQICLCITLNNILMKSYSCLYINFFYIQQIHLLNLLLLFAACRSNC